MVKHIVFWKLRDIAAGKPALENAFEIKVELEALNGRIPGLLKLEVGIDFGRTPSSADVVLYAELEDREALEVYLKHPDHVATAEFVRDVVEQRAVMDYEVASAL